jgi:hypothetical protein
MSLNSVMMVGGNPLNRSKQKGTAFESSIVPYLQAVWNHRIERRTLSGAKDRGDIAGFGTLGSGEFNEFVIECKNHKAMDIGTWVKEMETERSNANSQAGFVVHKRRGTTHAGSQYVTTTLCDLVRFGHLMFQAGKDTDE